MNPEIVKLARRIRASLPHLSLSEALTYADPSTVQGKIFRRRGGDGSFFGTGFSRSDISFASAWYATLWGPARQVRGVRLGPCARLETEDEGVKRAFGAMVNRDHAPLVAWERYARIAKRKGLPRPAWPGTRNMRPSVTGGTNGAIRAWIASQGLDLRLFERSPSQWIEPIQGVHTEEGGE